MLNSQPGLQASPVPNPNKDQHQNNQPVRDYVYQPLKAQDLEKHFAIIPATWRQRVEEKIKNQYPDKTLTPEDSKKLHSLRQQLEEDIKRYYHTDAKSSTGPNPGNSFFDDLLEKANKQTSINNETASHMRSMSVLKALDEKANSLINAVFQKKKQKDEKDEKKEKLNEQYEEIAIQTFREILHEKNLLVLQQYREQERAYNKIDGNWLLSYEMNQTQLDARPKRDKALEVEAELRPSGKYKDMEIAAGRDGTLYYGRVPAHKPTALIDLVRTAQQKGHQEVNLKFSKAFESEAKPHQREQVRENLDAAYLVAAGVPPQYVRPNFFMRGIRKIRNKLGREEPCCKIFTQDTLQNQAFERSVDELLALDKNADTKAYKEAANNIIAKLGEAVGLNDTQEVLQMLNEGIEQRNTTQGAIKITVEGPETYNTPPLSAQRADRIFSKLERMSAKLEESPNNTFRWNQFMENVPGTVKDIKNKKDEEKKNADNTKKSPKISPP